MVKNYFFSNDTGFDFIAFFSMLYKRKLTLLLIITLSCLTSYFYAKKQNEVWLSEAIISEPSNNDISLLKSSLSNISPFPSVETSELKSLITKEKIFDIFMTSFNSIDNKEKYLKKTLSDNDISSTSIAFLSRNILSTSIGPQKDNIKSLQLSYHEQTKSQELLSGYILYVTKITQEYIYVETSALLNNLRSITQSELNFKRQVTKDMLNSELEKSKIEYNIAKKSNINLPFSALNENDIFNITIGSKALKEKIKELEKLKDHSLLSPDILIYKNQLSLLDNIEVNTKLTPFSFISTTKVPQSKLSPILSKIMFIGFIFGLMLGTTIITLHHLLRDKKA